MKHCKFFTLLMMLSASVSIATAQINITSGNFPAVGSVVSNYEAYDVTVATGSGGANQTWTIPDYPLGGPNLQQIVAPGGTPFAAHFPTATHCITMDQSMSYSYARIATNGAYLLGFATHINDTLDIIFAYDSEALQAPLPLSYPHANWTTVSRITQELFPGFTLVNLDSTTHVLDGWGTLNTPVGNMSVLRDFQHQWTITQITGQPPTIDESVGYGFYGPQGYNGAFISSPAGVTDPNFTTGDVTVMVMGGTAVDPVRGPVANNFNFGQNYPNPFNPNTNLPLELSQTARVTLDVYDETGRLVSSESMELPAGHHNLPVDGSNWASGNYFARLTAGEQSITQKMKLVK